MPGTLPAIIQETQEDNTLETRRNALKKTWSSVLIGSVLFSTAALQAEPSIDVDATVVSNYVFRGLDIHQKKFDQDGEEISGFNMAPAFQPSINFNLDNGMFFNIWTSFALTGREDTDTDGQYQFGPGGLTAANILTPGVDLAAPFRDAGTGCNTTGSCTDAEVLAAVAGGTYVAPGFYNENNGLRRFDEVDLTLGYEVEHKLGTMSGGIVAYVLPNPANGVTGVDQFTEFFVGFAPAALPGLGITYYAEVNGDGGEGTTYTYIDYGYDIELGGDMSLGLGVGAGYQVQNQLQGWRNVDAGVSLGMGGFSVGVTAVYRPNLAFFDTDSAGKNVPAWLANGSTKFDGQVADPSKTTGLANSYINSLISTSIDPTGGFTYTPRQKLPTVVYYVSLGYSTSF